MTNDIQTNEILPCNFYLVQIYVTKIFDIMFIWKIYRKVKQFSILKQNIKRKLMEQKPAKLVINYNESKLRETTMK